MVLGKHRRRTLQRDVPDIPKPTALNAQELVVQRRGVGAQ